MGKAVKLREKHVLVVVCVGFGLMWLLLGFRSAADDSKGGSARPADHTDQTDRRGYENFMNIPKAEVTSDKEAMVSQEYFGSYARSGIHKEMLSDQVRTLTYRKAMMDNKHLFYGKVVLDIGCGTGILSMFAAKAGAAKVIGIDASDIIDQARGIVLANGLDKVVILIKGKVEEVALPAGVDKVDIIVSEWMGYFLLYESMLQTVLYARDRWLAPDGMIFPDRAALYISAIEDNAIEWWNNVYGFDMSVMKKPILRDVKVDVVDARKVVSDTALIKDIDLYTVRPEDLEFNTSFHLQFLRNGVVNGFVSFFDIEFRKCTKKTGFSTAPWALYTHWQQTVFIFDEPDLHVKKGEVIQSAIAMKQSTRNYRHLDIVINVDFKGKLSKRRAIQYFRMGT